MSACLNITQYYSLTWDRIFWSVKVKVCHAVWGVDLQPFACWNCGFESRRGMDVCSLNVVPCIGRGVCRGSTLDQSSPSDCVSLRVIRCNNNPLHLQWVTRRVKLKTMRKYQRIAQIMFLRTLLYTIAVKIFEGWFMFIMLFYLVYAFCLRPPVDSHVFLFLLLYWP